jgi:hypothetical protein
MVRSSRLSHGRARGVRRLALLAILPAVIALGCTPNPAAPSGVITAPTSYTVVAASPGGIPAGAVNLCYFGNTALELRTAIITSGSLTWTFDGFKRQVWREDDVTGIDQVTVVLPPGCGVLTLSGFISESEPYMGPSSVTVWITVAPS